MTGFWEIVTGVLTGLFDQPALGVIVPALGAGAVVLWMAAAWWAWRDLGARVSDPLSPYLAATGILVSTPLLFPLAVVVYRLVRPQDRAGELEAAHLREVALLERGPSATCVTCDRPVEDAWQRCPSCGARLAEACAACARPLDPSWSICPWCAEDRPAHGGDAA